MGTQFGSVHAQCPYFKTYDDYMKSIKCEGIIPGTTVTHRFTFSEDYYRQMEIFCRDHYETCEYRLALEGYWETD